MRRLIALLSLITVLGALAPGAALAATPKTTLYDVEDEVMCVSCGVPLSIAESPQATAERDEISGYIRQGMTKQQIKDTLVANYGPRILAKPQDKGFGRAAYLVPIAIVLLAIIALAIIVPRWRRARASEPEGAFSNGSLAAGRLTDADARRLDADLARYDV